MKKIWLVMTMMLLVFTMGCSTNNGQEDPKHSNNPNNNSVLDENPGIEGYVVAKENGRILVVSPEPQDFSSTGGVDEFYDAIWFSNVPEEIGMGAFVQVWMDAVAESYPGQAKALRIELIDRESSDQQSISESEAIRRALESDRLKGSGMTVVISASYDESSDVWDIQLKQGEAAYSARVSAEQTDVAIYRLDGRVSDDLGLMLLNETDLTIHYHGYAEYGHNETLKEIKTDGENKVYVFEGIMTDGSGLVDENGDRFGFTKEFTVTPERITSQISSDHLEHVSTSIFQERVLLQKPLNLNHSWVEQATFNGRAYEAVSTIVLVDLGDNGESVYEVETVIENIDGFPSNLYKEKIRFEEGKGMTFFQNTMQHLDDPLDDEGYTFGYGLSVIQ